MPVTVFRTLLIYLMVVVAMRLMGKRQLGELQPSELVSTILISNLASIPIESTEIPLAASAVPVFLIVCLEICLSAVGVRNQKIATLMSGKPKTVIENGVLDQTALEELRFTVDDLLEALRQKDVFSLKEVHLAIVETSGLVSVFKNRADTPPTIKDAGLATPLPAQPPVAVAVNGEIDRHMLTYCHKNEQWFYEKLKLEGLLLSEVLLFMCTEQEEYLCIKKEDTAAKKQRQKERATP